MTPVTKPTKTWIAAVGGVLSVAVPFITSLLTYLPPEWAAVISGVIGLLTVLGVYTVPNKPTGDVVVPAPQAGPSMPGVNEAIGDAVPATGNYHNPWRA